MKIMLVLPWFEVSGAEMMVADLAKELKKRGHDVLIVSLYNRRTSISDEVTTNGVKIKYLDKHRGIDTRIVCNMYSIIKAFNPDVIHTHLNVMKYVVPVAALLRYKKIYHTVHNVADKEQRKADRILTNFFVKVLGVKLVGIAPQVTESIAKEYNIPTKSIPTIYNGRNLKDFLCERDYSFNGTIKILHVGRFAEQKNHEMIVNAFKQVKNKVSDVVLLLVGDGELMTSIKEQVHQLDLDSDVIFLGIRDDINEIMKSSDIFILPSKYEGMPIVLIEAMASGLPIIVTPVGGIPDMISNDVNGLMVADYRSDTELSDAICKLIDNEQIREKIGRKAKTDANRYSSQEMTELYLKLYQQNM